MTIWKRTKGKEDGAEEVRVFIRTIVKGLVVECGFRNRDLEEDSPRFNSVSG